jgi:2-polyprenyl-3-methyl-5-hydroxy-6-metoxy-1,4-benzoquinol methylase
MVDSLEVIKLWDLCAEQYAAKCSKYGDLNKQVLLTPAILGMLDSVEGKHILDAGCGEGFLSRLMAEQGACVTAVDYSVRPLEIAAERTADGLRIDYIPANLESLDMLDDNAFDIVVSCVVIQDVLDYQAALKEMYHVLRPGGTCILAMLHPCFSSDGGWARNSNGEKLYWKMDKYFHERAVKVPWSPDSDNRLVYFHRTLTSYFRAITRTGFALEELVEPHPSQGAIEEHPQFVDDLRMRHFLVLKLRK